MAHMAIVRILIKGCFADFLGSVKSLNALLIVVSVIIISGKDYYMPRSIGSVK